MVEAQPRMDSEGLRITRPVFVTSFSLMICLISDLEDSRSQFKLPHKRSLLCLSRSAELLYYFGSALAVLIILQQL